MQSCTSEDGRLRGVVGECVIEVWGVEHREGEPFVVIKGRAVDDFRRPRKTRRQQVRVTYFGADGPELLSRDLKGREVFVAGRVEVGHWSQGSNCNYCLNIMADEVSIGSKVTYTAANDNTEQSQGQGHEAEDRGVSDVF